MRPCLPAGQEPETPDPLKKSPHWAGFESRYRFALRVDAGRRSLWKLRTGLSIARRVVNIHDGSLSLTDLEQGLTAELFFPHKGGASLPEDYGARSAESGGLMAMRMP